MKKKEIPVLCNDWIQHENCYIFALLTANAICCLKDNRVHYLFSTPDDIYTRYMYIKMLKCNNKIVFVPYRSKYLTVIDLCSKKYKCINIRFDYDMRSKEIMFREAFCVETKVYMLGFGFSAIIVFDTNTEKFERIDIPTNNIGRELGYCNFGKAFISKNVYLSLANQDMLMKMNLDSRKLEICSLPFKLLMVSAVSSNGTKIYILGRDDEKEMLIQWDPYTNKYIRFVLYNIDKDSIRHILYPPIVFENKIYIFPFYGRKSYIIDIETHTVKEFSDFNALFLDNKENPINVLALKICGDRLSFQLKESSWIEYSIQDNKVLMNERRIMNSEKYCRNLELASLKELLNIKGTISENEYSLKCYLDSFCGNSLYVNKIRI